MSKHQPPVPTWITRRQRVAQMTLRDGDVPGFDVARCIADLKACHVSVLTLFAGGYVAIYPSELDWQRVVPGLDGRDLFGEILTAGRAAGIEVVPCIDIGEIPVELWESHRHLVPVDRHGEPFRKSSVTFQSCPLGPYKRDCTRELLDELTARYEVDSIKFAGASYNLTKDVCHCPACEQAWRAHSGRDLPDDKNDLDYDLWRQSTLIDLGATLKAMAAERGLITVGNSVWHLGRDARDIADTAANEVVTQVEVQSRFYNVPPESDTCWERFGAPIETCRYLDGLTPHPTWVVASYFLAWPWRWVAVPAAEQHAYLAQVVANGCSPMINFTTGAPHQHYDQRGMPGIAAVFGFTERHHELLQGDRSLARVGLVYDHPSSVRSGAVGDRYAQYLHEFHGIQEALDRHHLPYDIVSSRQLAELDAARFDVLLMPGAAACEDETGEELARLAQAGVGVVTTGAVGCRDIADQPRRCTPLWDLLGIAELDPWRDVREQDLEGGPVQPYARIADREHPLTAGVDCPVLALAGWWHRCRIADDAAVPVHRMEPFMLFPEGRADEILPDPAEPLVWCRDDDAGRRVHFALDIGRVAMRTAHPDPERLLVNALRWASRERAVPLVDGRPDLRLSLRGLPGKRLVHLINTGGRDRFRTEIEPLREIEVQLPGHASAARLADGGPVELEASGDGVCIRVPELGVYDVLVVE